MKILLKITIILFLLILFNNHAMAATTKLVFNANDIFNYATSDDTRLNQQGIARMIWDSPTLRYYLTYNDAPRDVGATAAQDLQSIQNILDWNAFAGYQGVSHVQLWFNGGIGGTWGEKIVMKSNTTLTVSVNGEFGWTAYSVANGDLEIAHFNTNLGGDPSTNQNAISPDFNPASTLWSITGDFFIDNDDDGQYNALVDDDLVIGQQYAIWFNSAFNNWHMVDAYGNDVWGSPDMQGTLIATAVPAPGAILLGSMGAGIVGWLKKRKSL